MKMRLNAAGIAIVLAFLSIALSTGCGGPLNSPPEEEHAEDQDAAVAYFDAPTDALAVGATRRYSLRVEPASAEVESISVRPSTDAVNVTEMDEHGFTIRAVAAGDTALDVDVHFKEHESDSAYILVKSAPAASVHLSHDCAGLAGGLNHPSYDEREEFRAQPYLVNTTARINIWVNDENGDHLESDDAFPLEWEPADALRFNRRENHAIIFETGEEPGIVTIKSKLDDTTLQLELVEPGEVDAITAIEQGIPDMFESDQDALISDVPIAVHIAPMVDGDLICNHSLDVSMQSVTPEICQTRIASQDDDSLIDLLWDWEGRFFAFEVMDNGTCELQAHAPEANGGEGATWEHSLEVALPEDQQ